MKKIASVLLSAWLLSGIAVAVVCLLVWFFGPAIGYGLTYPLEPVLNRSVVIAALLLVWFVINFRRTKKNRAREKALIDGMAKPEVAPDPDATASAEEVALLGDRLKEALSTLRGTKKRGLFGGGYLYDLPWYMFIGPPGAGKTTALANSGLNFPLADAKGPAAVKGVGGTRNCDWWFTDDAVLIDTAGRYTTQDSQQAVDSAAWQGFLTLLKTHRRRQPINGVIVSISLSDLAMLSEEERLGHARAIKARIRELHDQFAVRFPIYVLFTKCDLVAGFSEFFSNLGKEEREQVWGMTFPLDDGTEEGGAVAHFPEEFDLLVDRLNDRLMERMQAEPDITARSLIYGFPQQFASLREVADEFLAEIFRPSRLETRPLLRGVYFTSGTQNGTPIDRLMGAMSGQFGLPRQSVTALSGVGKSFFLHRAIKDVAFNEAGVVSVDAKLERRQRLIQRGAYAAAAVILVLLTGAWATSYANNLGLIGASNAQADKYVEQYSALLKLPQGDTSLPPLLPALATLRSMPGGYADRNASPSILAEFGLYQGYKLGSQANEAYYRALESLLLPRLLARLEAQMLGNLGNTDFLYQALKVYLILGRSGPLDPGLVKQWMDADFAASFSGDANAPVRDALGQHVSALLERPVTAIPLNGPLIDQIRGILRQTPLARRSYARIIASEEAQALPPWRYSDHSGAAASSVLLLRSGKSLDTGVDGLYTFAGYHDTFAKLLPDVTKDVAEDSWVLGRQDRVQTDSKQIDQLRRDVLGLYLDDYTRKWDSLITDVQIKPFGTMSEGLDELNTLSGPNSPFRNLFQAFDAETQLVATTQGNRFAANAAKLGAEEAAKEANRITTTRDRRVAMMLGGVFSPGTPVIDPAQRVNDHFKWLHDFVGTPDKPGPIEAVLTKLAQIYQSFSQVSASPNAGVALLGAAASNSGSSLSTQLDTLGKTMPPPVQTMLRTVSQSSSSVTTSGAKQSIQDAWATKVLPLCQAALTNRYPLFQTSTTDVPMDDFVKLMAPGGLIAQFFDDYLKPFVDTTQTPWKWNGADNNQLGLSQNTLQQLQLAADIRSALFPSGGTTVALKFEVTPTNLDNGVGQVTLDLDGQELTYAHGPIQPMRMAWPGTGGRNQVRLTFAPISGASTSVTKEGPWALFRLLDAGKSSSTQSDRVTYTWSGGGGTASFLFAAGSVVNAFTLPALHQFRCPTTL
jgi:type VI secretion system protein ImpL